jgi:pimeloyl-ACP methyl ester carboxylesterase
MLAAEFAACHPETRALVLLSAHRGGADILRLTCDAGQLAADRLEDALALARERVSAEDGHHLMMLPGWWYVISAESLLDRLSNTPDTLTAAERIRCPVLYVRGDCESSHVYPAEEFQRRMPAPGDVVIVPGCDHFYVGKEPEIARIVCEWLTHTLSGDAQL